jgi:ubiquinone/menaquinone biosynthesis C-methylase UbiE
MSSFTESLPKKFNPLQILDLGCGNGNVTSRLLQKFPEANYTLVDASQEMISLCQNQFKKFKVDCVESYFQDFTFTEDKYDLVVAGFSLHHCNSTEKKELFKKIYASLKKKGAFACADLMISKNNPEHSNLNAQWKRFVHKSFPDGEKWKWLMEHYNEFDKPDNLSDQINWLKDARFSKIENISFENYWVHFRAIKN